MISLFRSNIRRRAFMLLAITGSALFVTACGVQETNSYPVEIFSEMHYAQSSRLQEPPRLDAPAEAVVYSPVGNAETELDVPEFQTRAYDPAVAGELYRINCAVCHGLSGQGDGPAAAHLTSSESFWTTSGRGNYAPPPNLIEVRNSRPKDVVFGTVRDGLIVMPAFGKLMSEEDIWDIVEYLFDENAGLGS